MIPNYLYCRDKDIKNENIATMQTILDQGYKRELHISSKHKFTSTYLRYETKYQNWDINRYQSTEPTAIVLSSKKILSQTYHLKIIYHLLEKLLELDKSIKSLSGNLLYIKFNFLFHQ